MSNIDVSIIIPVYNVEPYIAECINSVMNQQTSCIIECLLIDDKGADGSMMVAKDCLSSYTGSVRFRIVEHAENRGLSAARNTGIRTAHGKYVYFLDSDDVIPSDCIEKLYHRTIQYPGTEIIIGNFQTFPVAGVHDYLTLTHKDYPEYSDDIGWIRSIWMEDVPVISCNKLISRDFIIKYGLYFREGIYHEDNHWQALAYPFVTNIAFVKDLTYMYRIRPGSITQSTDNLQRRIDSLAVICKELFSRKFEWDIPWVKWVSNRLGDFRYGRELDCASTFTSTRYHYLIKCLWKNEAIPLSLRCIYRYHGMPTPLMNIHVYSVMLKIFIRFQK
ncbi:glycosyltransferase family 2 protein [uncultured Muribaculum sp.]|uniref:glycosyltransferase family 2 protein n=1 Tax=uncultured Muribaculum sp. TaxID=1918613 RepID=UPI00272F617F|nr:glycosyltransferase family 2 protein [uncultured Muribaculum sp.]